MGRGWRSTATATCSELAFQGGLDQPLGQVGQQAVLAGQLQPTFAGSTGEPGDQLLDRIQALGCRRRPDHHRRPDTSEEREPMSSDPSNSEEKFSEFVRRPTRTAGDLSEVAGGPAGITTEDVARDLEAVASKRGVPTESELLADLLRRVQPIEEHLGIHES
jgi:hypothetical protein